MSQYDGESLITPEQIAAYQQDGALCLRGFFKDWISLLAAGVARNIAEPGPFSAENTKPGEPGRFFDDYVNWQRIEEFRQFITASPIARIAAEVMQSKTAQFFHDHVLVKEPGTEKASPWHQDIPYYCVEGEQTVSFWLPLDPVPLERSVQIVKGSHRWPKLVKPVRWLNDDDFYGSLDDYLDIPDIEGNPDRFPVMSWELEPGDAVLFSFKALHGAPGNKSSSERRRAVSMRWVGDDARFIQRPGKTSPPFPGIDQKPGERLREDWFPVLWPPAA